ncbi:interferon regulatory factor 10 isoform X5 [Hypomesus transpacificus]|uniref:interferon regulatory factor 10 isoform X5 n=1 Tax=Hypomesus transpacificus TaxID=137520 RepID=UPI001F081EB5|nr:interferon regulatory factor 10 isoform X5 [Hypomesus transpacificus]
MEERIKNLRLKEWLIAQIDSGQYAGLSWENEEKSLFRIPWKHAAKQDYKQNEDAALFKAWAVYKGKYREGRDKADPTMWKTRLRCALNKSTDFQEVPEHSQLDLSEPYKVYRINTETDTDMGQESSQIKGHVSSHASPSSITPINLPVPQPQQDYKNESQNGDAVQILREAVVREHMYHWSEAPQDHRLPSLIITAPALTVTSISDIRLQGQGPLGSERIYGPCSAQQISFPPPAVLHLPPDITQAMTHLLPHLERGVLVWVAPDGLFIKRFCQGRVYWSGPLAQHTDRPNKLDRERTCKLLDMHIFQSEFRRYIQGEGHRPLYEIALCFGEEFPDSNLQETNKLIMAQVVPLFAVDLLQSVQTAEKQHLDTSRTHGGEGQPDSPPPPQP